LASKAIPRAVRVVAVDSRVSQSEEEPITKPTSGFEVVVIGKELNLQAIVMTGKSVANATGTDFYTSP
jgi:hypothetical protein